MSLVIREGKPQDAALIFDLVKALATYEKLAHEVKASTEDFKRALNAGHARVLIAEWESEPCGLALYFFNFSTFLGKRGVYLEDLFVKETHRGKGIGKALLAGLARVAVDNDCGRLEWAVLDWNEPAIAFYKSLGAKAMDEWTVYRVTGDSLSQLARGEMIRIALVVAMAKNGSIGDKGALPWRISDDLKWFKKVTLGKPVIMGRKTFDSIGKPLPGRDNIVVTRSLTWNVEGVVRTRSVDDALSVARKRAAETGADEVCVIGGAEIFAETLAKADRIYLTEVDGEVAGDVKFPQFDRGEWAETPQGACDKGPRNEFSCRFSILDRAAA